jgi:hypothetical protein
MKSHEIIEELDLEAIKASEKNNSLQSLQLYYKIKVKSKYLFGFSGINE